MSYMKSRDDVEKYSATWRKNLVPYQQSVTKRKYIPAINNPLDDLTRMPKENTIIGRFQFLSKNEKSKNGRFKVIANQLKKLWMKFNFPIITDKSIVRKIEALINKHDNFLKRPINECGQIKFSNVFDIVKTDGIWLATEDKNSMKYRFNHKVK